MVVSVVVIRYRLTNTELYLWKNYAFYAFFEHLNLLSFTVIPIGEPICVKHLTSQSESDRVQETATFRAEVGSVKPLSRQN